MKSFGTVDDSRGYFSMQVLGPSALEEVKRVELEQHKSKTITYGLPLASVVKIGVSLVILMSSFCLGAKPSQYAQDWLPTF